MIRTPFLRFGLAALGLALILPRAALSHEALTAQSALATEEHISAALRDNDTSTLRQLLAPDWIVISAYGGRTGRDDILAAIKAGIWTHTSLVISNPRVRIYGNVALVTTHASVSGMSMHKPYVNVQECQTDVLYWHRGTWVSELLHESFNKPNANC
jgi:ketosteroid isomerase-like protein